MKTFRICLVVTFTVLACFSKQETAQGLDYPNVPKDLDKESFCDKKDDRIYGHTVVVLDLTSKLKQAQIDYIGQIVFSEQFYTSYRPFTKFSYILINKNSPQSQQYVFSKCRPKTGTETEFKNPKDNSFFRKVFKNSADSSSADMPTSNESRTYVEKWWDKFIDHSKNAFKTVFKDKEIAESEKSLIYETIISIFRMPKLDFTSNYPERTLIIVSDMMQHSERISFYDFCKTKGASKPNLCPKLDQLLSNSSTKEYIKATSPNDKNNVNIKIIFLNNRYETNRSLDTSLINLWIEYFEREGFKTPEVERQLDIM